MNFINWISKKFLLKFFLICALSLCSCASPKVGSKPDFTKKLEIKKTILPRFNQSNQLVEISYFTEHPDLEIRKEYVTHRRYANYQIYGILISGSAAIYGVLADEKNIEIAGAIGIATSYLFLPFFGYNLRRIARKHNKLIDAKTALIFPDYNHLDGSASLKASFKF